MSEALEILKSCDAFLEGHFLLSSGRHSSAYCQMVGIVALPLAIAFGIASGVSPEKGIITAIVAGFIISLLYRRVGTLYGTHCNHLLYVDGYG